MKESKEGKQIGAKIDADLWWSLRTLAFQKGTTATKLLNEAMREYLERHPGVPLTDRPPSSKTVNTPSRASQKPVKSKKKGEAR